jgi:hypothetical protein
MILLTGLKIDEIILPIKNCIKTTLKAPFMPSNQKKIPY